MFAVQMEKANTFQRLKPGVPKRILLFMAALVWSLAGVMLLTKGVLQLPEAGKAPWLKIAGGLAGGVAFYLLIFARISRRHARRIMDLDIEIDIAPEDISKGVHD